MYSQLSYDLGWDWYNAWSDNVILLHSPVARKGDYEVYLEGFSQCIFMVIKDEHLFRIEKCECRTISELDDCKHALLNKGFTIDWGVYQDILQMYNEHFKVYSPYIKD